MKNIFILYLFLGLLVGFFQLEGANSNPLGLFNSGVYSGEESVLYLDSSDFILTESIIDEVSEDVDSEVGILRKKSELQTFRIPRLISSKQITSVPFSRILLQHYTNLPPPAKV